MKVGLKRKFISLLLNLIGDLVREIFREEITEALRERGVLEDRFIPKDRFEERYEIIGDSIQRYNTDGHLKKSKIRGKTFINESHFLRGLKNRQQ